MTTTAKHPRRFLALTVSTLLLTGTNAISAAARPDAGDSNTSAAPTAAEHRCSLTRVGVQYVKCDNLTGNGVPAPAWLSSR